MTFPLNQQVPTADSLNNNTFVDVVGNKNDGHTGDSIMALVHVLNDHAHKPQLVYPTLAAAVTLTKAAGAYAAFPTPTEIVPVSTITDDFDVHFITVSNVSANGDYEICLYSGAPASEVLIGCASFQRTANKDHANLKIQTPLIPANVRISAAISSSNAAADTADVKIEYHLY
jgi:hypothetical protein